MELRKTRKIADLIWAGLIRNFVFEAGATNDSSAIAVSERHIAVAADRILGPLVNTTSPSQTSSAAAIVVTLQPLF